jgi:hypothetical protein
MKKILSLILALTMVSSLVMALFVGVSASELAKSYADAKDGDLLWEADFKSTSGAYNPGIITSVDSNLDTVVTPSADGKSLNVTFTSESSKGFAWGEAVKGLKVTADTKYTVDFTWKDNGLDYVGVTFLTGNSKDPWASWHTLYGGLKDKKHSVNVSGTSQKVFPNADFKFALTDGYATAKAEIYGYYVRIYALTADGYKLAMTYRLNETEQAAANIACGMFSWTNAGKATQLDIKSFKVTKGTPLTDAALAVSYAGVGLNDAYKNAKNGDLIWSANFNGDANFAPKAWGAECGANTTITVADDGKTLVAGDNAGGSAGAYYYANAVAGLAITAETKYTIEFKTKSTGNYGGAIFYYTPDYAPDSFISWYTAHDNNSTTIARGAQTSPYTANGQMKKSYDKLEDRATDTDGFWDVKVEIDGFKVTAYYKTTKGEYKQAYSYVMDDVNAVIACGAYNYQPTAVTTVKDFNVYKGLALTPETTAPVTTKAPDTTKASDTTKAPVTTKTPETTKAPATEAPETKAPVTEAPKGGCGSVIGIGAVVVATVAAAVIVSKKKED